MTALCSGKICTIFPEKGALNFWKACTIALEYSGEVTHIDDTPADQFFFAQFGEQWEKKPPAITVKFKTLQGDVAKIQCRIADDIYQVGEQVNIRYIKTENGYFGYILRKEESSL